MNEHKTDRILLLCQSDNCNRTYKMVHALRSAGANCDGYKLAPHKWYGEDQLPIISLDKMHQMSADYDVIWLTMGNYRIMEKLRGYVRKGKRFFVTHSGTQYRQSPDIHNRVFNRYVEKSIILGHDHMILGAKNPTFNSCRIIDTEKLKPVYNNRKIPVFGHFPSNLEKKGTSLIWKVLKEFRGKITVAHYDGVVPFDRNISRMAACDVYIDQLKPYQNGKVFGEMGNQSYEAAALGCIVISNLTDNSYYKQAHGHMPVKIANDTTQLRAAIQSVIDMSVDDRIDLQKKHRAWIDKTHSFQSMGKSLLEIVTN